MDGAHAGVAAILPEQRHHFRGIELADSFNTNPHKWLLTTFDCSCIWFRDADPLKAALSLTPAYLRGKGNAYDYQVTLDTPERQLACLSIDAPCCQLVLLL